ncbi:peptide ABC transporter substrate-binding protein [Vibrio sp. UCD-FRSSP16_10]|uniref:ABC transporter ATP-binding protein n=1 Tax=unclassified Vibrio TaxID=2614977 RepID=UPI0007FBB5A7|nr:MULTISPECIES: dipeptide ABC transporter ATP-binding protein [unclassified Vibrio]OBT13367.1 peptide ABC transporter substrate-binding protein [Vibrio sp. UCD-FRSSP16_10]OBT17877.1 peptide ABC transporter substrate-binding protein [Vibrio sp. UCD-FRSSP16_30]
MTQATPLLQVKDLKQHFLVSNKLFQAKKYVYAVDGVSFDIYPGETIGLVGESGCGKSTVGRTLLKLYEPTSGSIFFEGRDITGLNPKQMTSLRKEMQVILQDPLESLNQRHTVGDILREPFQIHGVGTAKEQDQWVSELLIKVGLRPDAASRFPHEFSGGQRQRIGIARAIALKPKLIVCDESVSALDVSVQAQIVNLLLDLQKEMNIALIFIAHDLSVVRHVSDVIAVMYLGKFVEIGKAEDVFNTPKHPYTKALISAIPQPDPWARKDRIILKGDIPSPMNPPPGCAFSTRCHLAQKSCFERPQTLSDGEHRVACHLVES